MKKLAFLKKATLIFLLISSLFCSIFATSCFQVQKIDKAEYEGILFFDKNSFRFEFTPKEEYSEVSLFFIIYDAEYQFFKKYNEEAFTWTTSEIFYNVEPGKDYLFEYTLDTELFPDRIISNVEVNFHSN